MRRKLRAAELAKFRAKVERDPGAHHKVRVARVRAGHTMAELAGQASVTPGTLGAIERGRSPGTWSTRKRLARALKLPVAELF
ncbi:MAG: helix-turn-helix transcriptional regulator [Thermoleophilaceae bacterium]